jgi:hypothetical protein
MMRSAAAKALVRGIAAEASTRRSAACGPGGQLHASGSIAGAALRQEARHRLAGAVMFMRLLGVLDT